MVRFICLAVAGYGGLSPSRPGYPFPGVITPRYKQRDSWRSPIAANDYVTMLSYLHSYVIPGLIPFPAGTPVPFPGVPPRATNNGTPGGVLLPRMIT